MRSNFAILLAALAYAVNPALAATKVMFLGDSITGSPGCWRALLWNQLINAGKTDIDFVGTLPAQGCGITYDGDNEGHGGYLATGIANQNLLPAWLAATTPDIVAMTLGTNDVSQYSTSLGKLDAKPSFRSGAASRLLPLLRPTARLLLLVAQILPMAPSGCTDCGQRVINLNSAIPAWAQNKSTSASPITVVDLWTGFNTTSDTYDGVHPNENGNAKIAASWYPTLYNTL